MKRLSEPEKRLATARSKKSSIGGVEGVGGVGGVGDGRFGSNVTCLFLLSLLTIQSKPLSCLEPIRKPLLSYMLSKHIQNVILQYNYLLSFPI